MKKIISAVIAASMLVASLPAFARITETEVPTIDNAAVVVKEGVNAHQSMRIEGDVYAGGQVKFDNAGNDFLDGDIISAQSVAYQDQYSAILKPENRKGVDKTETDMGQYLDQYFSGQYLVDNSTKPVAPTDDGVVYTKNENWFSINEWDYHGDIGGTLPKDENGYPYYTISENTQIDGLNVQGGKLVIDASESPIYLKVKNQFGCSTANDRGGYIEVIGNNPVYIFAPFASEIRMNVVYKGNNKFDFGNGNVTWVVTSTGDWQSVGKDQTLAIIAADIFCETKGSNVSFNCPVKGDIVTDIDPVSFGSQFSLDGDIYSYGTGDFNFDGKIVGDIVTKAENVKLSNSGQYNDERITGNINAINAKTYSVGCHMVGNTVTSAETFVITGGANTEYVANIEGTVYAPNADVTIQATSDNGIRRGQLIAKSLDIYGEGAVIWGHAKNPDEDVTPEPAATEAPAVTEEPTPEPTEEPTPEPTKVPLPDGEEIVLEGGYAYIFGDEPEVDENGVPYVNMSPERNVSREELCAMVMRMIDQEYDTQDKRYPVTSKISAYDGAWYERGLAYMVSTGAFDDVDEVWLGAVTRGEVAKLITFGLNLDASMAEETGFTDIEENPYKTYIEIMYGYGYMSGMDGDKFAPDQYMTRAQFCSMFNAIIGRTDMGLETADGQVITPETYSIADLPAKFWGTDAMLKATSAYDEDGYVDITLRHNNIRNVLDNYDSQLDY